MTPLIRVVGKLGYDVDVLLLPDNPETADLIIGAPGVRDIFVIHRGRIDTAATISRLKKRQYDIATFTTLSMMASRLVTSLTRYSFNASDWHARGDTANIATIALSLGWSEPLPAPFAMTSSRIFGLPKGTVALHPGCKPNWPWKKWHGFDQLASCFHDVVIIGTPADLDNHLTYFKRPFRWPRHARSFVGLLDLLDTAALLSECAAVISIDSGMMHLAVAVGIPAYGIFGITSPARECMRSPLMIPITKQLQCETACRQRPWGRRDCEHHLACLKTLTPEEVIARVRISGESR